MALIGRNSLLSALDQAADEATSVTLRGLPGVGKSAVAHAWLRGREGQHVWLRPSDLVGSRPASDGIDTFVIEDADDARVHVADFVHGLRHAGDDTLVLALSTCPLGVEGERILEMAPLLTLPGDDGHSEAGLVLCELASRHGIVVTAAEAEALALALEGIPHWLELAVKSLRIVDASSLLARRSRLFEQLETPHESGSTLAHVRRRLAELPEQVLRRLVVLTAIRGAFRLDELHDLFGTEALGSMVAELSLLRDASFVVEVSASPSRTFAVPGCIRAALLQHGAAMTPDDETALAQLYARVADVAVAHLHESQAPRLCRSDRRAFSPALYLAASRSRPGPRSAALACAIAAAEQLMDAPDQPELRRELEEIACTVEPEELPAVAAARRRLLFTLAWLKRRGEASPAPLLALALSGVPADDELHAYAHLTEALWRSRSAFDATRLEAELRVLDDCAVTDDVFRMNVERARVALASARGDIPGSITAARRFVVLSNASGESAAREQATVTLVGALFAGGATEEAERSIDQYLQLYGTSTVGAASILAYRGFLRAEEGNVREARADFAASFASSERYGVSLAWPTMGRAYCDAFEGSWADALAQASRVAKMQTSRRPTQEDDVVLAALSILHATCGQLAPATAYQAQLAKLAAANPGRAAVQLSGFAACVVRAKTFPDEAEAARRELDLITPRSTWLLRSIHLLASKSIADRPIVGDALWLEGDIDTLRMSSGVRIVLAGSPALRRLVSELVEHHDSRAFVATDSLIKALWPEERYPGKLHRNRVASLVRRLRRGGLDGVLESAATGYRLRPDLEVRRLPP